VIRLPAGAPGAVRIQMLKGLKGKKSKNSNVIVPYGCRTSTRKLNPKEKMIPVPVPVILSPKEYIGTFKEALVLLNYDYLHMKEILFYLIFYLISIDLVKIA
jgi:hypothetical protein